MAFNRKLDKYLIETLNDYIIVNGSKILLFRERDADKLNWNLSNAQYIIDSTGVVEWEAWADDSSPTTSELTPVSTTLEEIKNWNDCRY